MRLREAAEFADFAQEHRGRIAFWQFVQYLFYRQWREMRAYAAARGVKILGICPSGVALGQRRRLGPARAFSPWMGKGSPPRWLGLPPDGFSADGQLWGNPLYRWDVLEAEGFAWWIRRIQGGLCFLRHPCGWTTSGGLRLIMPSRQEMPPPPSGEWRPGPGLKLFQALQDALGSCLSSPKTWAFGPPAVHRLSQERLPLV